MTDQPNAQDVPTLDELVTRKLADAETPGAVVEFDPEEAERIMNAHVMSARDRLAQGVRATEAKGESK